MTFKQLYKKHTTANFVFYLLVQCESGRWAFLWNSILDDDDLYTAVVTDDAQWFIDYPNKFAPVVTYEKESEALEEITKDLESLLGLREYESHEDFIESQLKRVRSRQKRALKSESANLLEPADFS